jgi:Domain of unknown function (DUF6457)
VNEWLEQARERLAAAAGEDPAALALDQQTVDDLLDLARVAARDSGERTSAPLLCYLVGLVKGRRGGDVSDLVDAVVGKAV